MPRLTPLLSSLLSLLPHVPAAIAPNDGHALGWHRHRCTRCHEVWAHNGRIMAATNDATHAHAHTCPACGNASDDQYNCI